VLRPRRQDASPSSGVEAVTQEGLNFDFFRTQAILAVLNVLFRQGRKSDADIEGLRHRFSVHRDRLYRVAAYGIASGMIVPRDVKKTEGHLPGGLLVIASGQETCSNSRRLKKAVNGALICG